MGEVRADPAACCGARDGVTHHAGGPEKHVLAPRRQRIGRGERRVPLPGQPGGKRRGWFGHNREGHLRVLVAAELGAFAPVDAGAVGLEPEAVLVAWYLISFGAQVWSPEAVD